jgi:hypothetical protein
MRTRELREEDNAVKKMTVLCVMVFLMALCAYKAWGEQISLVVDDKRLKTDAEPVMRSASVFVPLRGVLEHLKSHVTFDKSTGTVKAKRGKNTVVLVVGSTKAKVNGATTIMPIPAFIYKERTMVPLRFMSEALGYSVRWEPRYLTVYIYTKGEKSDDVDVKDVDTPDPDFK